MFFSSPGGQSEQHLSVDFFNVVSRRVKYWPISAENWSIRKLYTVWAVTYLLYIV